MNNNNFESLKNKLINAGQEHLVKAYLKLGHSQAGQNLLHELKHIDFSSLNLLLANLKPPSQSTPTAKISPLSPQNINSLSQSDLAKYTQKGLNLIENGKIACFLVAGGQGSRLGHNGPKGTFNLGLDSNKSLFELQAQRLKVLSKNLHNSSSTIPWYIMTSPNNHQETVSYFESHKHFGLNKNDIFFFCQGSLPMVSPKGKILMSSESTLATGPNGNGGCFKALKDSDALANMQKRGIEYVFFHNIDNALIKIADPVFIGLTAINGHSIGSKVVAKKSSNEKVGLLVLQNNKPAVIEYSDMPANLSTQQNESGDLLYNNGNIGIHLFSLDFLVKHATSTLPFHLAHKKVPTHANPNPTSPNAIKFEMFMFDIFSLSSSMTVFMVNRNEEFAPVKNKQGNDSPKTAKALLLNLYKQTKKNDLI